MNLTEKTPMMQQYWRYRKELSSDTILLFRLGDFYELFYKDAEEGSKILGITLTKRHNAPMAGIPFHAAGTYIPKLLSAGKKVALCDQIETPQAGKLVKRALTRILTPGTTLEDNQLEARSNHYLLALHFLPKEGLHAAWLDLSTGRFLLATDSQPQNLFPLFHALAPKEIILPEGAKEAWRSEAWQAFFQPLESACTVSEVAPYLFDAIDGGNTVKKALGVLNLEGFGLSQDHPALGSAGALIAYVTENLCQAPQNLTKIEEYKSTNSLLLDPATLRNLEIFKSSQNTREGSLLSILDATVTAAGARLLEQYLAAPLLDLPTLRHRQNCVAAFREEHVFAKHVQNHLRHVRDLTRILSRLQNRLCSPRELGAIRDTLRQLPFLLEELKKIQSEDIAILWNQIPSFDTLRNLLIRALNEELPATLQEGGCLHDSYDEKLTHLRSLARNHKGWICDLEREEQTKTGIRNLKIKYNGVFGYFIEITKSNLSLVPPHYIRRQTMTNAERFVTEPLKQKEKEIFQSEELSIAREEALFQELLDSVLKESEALRKTAEMLAQVDLFIGWAQIARERNYCCPMIDESNKINIQEGRHPVVEEMLQTNRHLGGSHAFVPNDTHLSSNEEQITLITGPNMAGKSTYIRQVALIVLMAQIGSWVPARQCQMGLVDRIFSRVGASDELARGNSTFMVEMNETANILNNATDKSLLILDEIGRGTSTYDGLSIAWAVVEHLHGQGDRGPKTLFATHYHEITQLEKTLPRLRNYSVSVKEWNDEIIFVRQVIRGAADRSYGIQVARLAGLPQTVINRAKVILKELETEGNVLIAKSTPPKTKVPAPIKKPGKRQLELSLFSENLC